MDQHSELVIKYRIESEDYKRSPKKFNMDLAHVDKSVKKPLDNHIYNTIMTSKPTKFSYEDFS
jgi:hypothetical protein